jgi:hypothetical protein
VDTAHGELQAGTRRAGDGLLLVATRTLDTDGTLGTLQAQVVQEGGMLASACRTAWVLCCSYTGAAAVQAAAQLSLLAVRRWAGLPACWLCFECTFAVLGPPQRVPTAAGARSCKTQFKSGAPPRAPAGAACLFPPCRTGP